ncbi:MAG: biotin--[Clostridia bacterium]|nr:biotin--[acetyl-CoA-carboxylase] ligase [Clostridia bacterium]
GLADKVSRNRIVAEVANQFDILYEDLEKAEFLEEYRKKSCLIGKKVVVMPIHNEQYYATVKDIDEKAQLVVEVCEGKVLALSGGEVSVVPEM